MKKIILYIMAVIVSGTITACSSNDETKTPQILPVYDMSGFVKGADVSWLTEQEFKNKKFYTANGVETECMELLRSMGVNAIRLRVWVNPTDYWNSKEDVLVKAYRAQQLGFRLMIDFHYSDTWADPGNQTPPAAWADYNLEEMKTAVANHTKEVLQLLKDNDIDVEWVQVGNETRTGMLKPLGAASTGNFGNFAALVTAGYDAVKSVYEDAKVIVHIDNAPDQNRAQWLFDGLKSENAKWDVIGLSRYPGDDTWEEDVNKSLTTIQALVNRYNKEVMICEIGTNWNATYAQAVMDKMYAGCKQIDMCLGIFYWEPQAYGGWNNYQKGAFDDSGRPTHALDCFAITE